MCEHRPYLDAASPIEEPKMLTRSSRWLRVAAVAVATAAGAFVLATGASQAMASQHPTQVKADVSWGSVHPSDVSWGGVQPFDVSWG
jgi:hypothetical protein